MVRERFRVAPKTKVDLSAIDTRQSDGLSKKEGREQLVPIKEHLNELQELLYATEKHALLILLQGMDTSGKDGVIKHVVEAFNPQGCQISGFKVPSREELGHDFLWRVHKVTPPRGMVGIFNRSQYEDVLVVRVEGLVPESVWRQRYQAINAFEELLAENGVVIVKFFLHISAEEQLERLEDRLANRRDQWKFKVGDLDARAKWSEYMAAYAEALQRCSTAHAPWYIIPADRKWYRNLIVSQILLETLEELKLEWPPLEPEAVGIKIS
ncbi:MAG: polyphosphate kinase 2 family protein [Anaerolineae bacterium]|nr:polyphosphate kinase 2 family protein [Anaerolineae bacterium]